MVGRLGCARPDIRARPACPTHAVPPRFIAAARPVVLRQAGACRSSTDIGAHRPADPGLARSTQPRSVQRCMARSETSPSPSRFAVVLLFGLLAIVASSPPSRSVRERAPEDQERA